MSDEDGAIPTGHNGRALNGRFLNGNTAAKGNPLNRRAQQLRAALLRAVTDDELQKAAAAVLAKARAGDVIAFRELCDRVLGRPSSSDLVDRVERLEAMIEEQRHSEY